MMCTSSLISGGHSVGTSVNLFPSAHPPLIGFFVFMSMCSPAETLYYWFWLNYLQSFKTDLLDKSRIQCVGNLSQFKEILHLGAPVVKYELKSFSCVLSCTLLRSLVINDTFTFRQSSYVKSITEEGQKEKNGIWRKHIEFESRYKSCKRQPPLYEELLLMGLIIIPITPSSCFHVNR